MVLSGHSFDCLCLIPQYFYFLGTTRGEEIPWKAMECVFEYFRNQELDFDKKKTEVGKCKEKTSNNGKREKRPLTANKIKG